MKMHLDWDEWYPVYSLDEPQSEVRYGMAVDVPEGLVRRYRQAHREWTAVQDKLHALRYEEHDG